MSETQVNGSAITPLNPGNVIVARARAPVAARTALMTVLFADLRGYTGMAERLPAVQVVPLLEEFFRVLAASVKTSGGEIYHMAGDGIMAGFGAKTPGNGAGAALAAGYSMLQNFAPIAERWRDVLSIEAGIGVGLHRGEVALGVLGPSRRRLTTIVGDTVNVASRLCSRARAGEVLFSCTVAAALRDCADSGAGMIPGLGVAPFLQLPQFELRGRRGPIDIWCVPASERLAL